MRSSKDAVVSAATPRPSRISCRLEAFVSSSRLERLFTSSAIWLYAATRAVSSFWRSVISADVLPAPASAPSLSRQSSMPTCPYASCSMSV